MTRFINDYTDDWRAVRDAAYVAVGFRCIRCRHPFTPVVGQTSPPLPCDDLCDTTRGRRINTHHPNARRDHPEKPLREIVSRLVHNIWDGGLSLTLHHFDGNKANNAWWNLLALCNSCHLTIQAKVVPERPYLWEHSEWIKPYVAGFYAHWYGRIDITHEQACAELDKYLAMGQPWLYADASH